jgi:hypothetical protein
MTVCLYHTEDGFWLCDDCLNSRPEAIGTDDVEGALDLTDGPAVTCDHFGRDIVAERTVVDILADLDERLSEMVSRG